MSMESIVQSRCHRFALTQWALVMLAGTFAVSGCAHVCKPAETSARAARIDVTKPPYDAKGDGITDNTEALQRAIQAASPGKTVFLPPGEYRFSQSLVNTENVTLLGAGREVTVLRITNDDAYGINLASGLHVRGLTLRGNNTPSPRAHAFNGGNTVGAVIEDCLIENWGAVAILGADHSCGNVVRNNIIRNNAHEGVYFGTNSDGNTILRNHIYNCAKNGIDVNGSHNRILYNVVHDIGKPGDSVDTVGIMAGNPAPNAATNNLIHGNTVYRCATHGIILWAVSKSHVVTENTCYENAAYGIFLEKLGADGQCIDHIVARNVARGNGDYGIILEATENCVVQGNKAVGNGKDGIAVDSTNGPAQSNALIENLCKWNKRYGLYVSVGAVSSYLESNRATRNAAGNIKDESEPNE